MLGIRLHGIRLALAVRIDQRRGYEVALRHRMCVCESERVAEDCFDGAPDLLTSISEMIWSLLIKFPRGGKGGTYVNDLETLFEKLVSFLWEVIANAILGGAVRLVDMHSFPWSTLDLGSVTNVLRCAADRVVKDQDARCSGAAQSISPIVQRLVYGFSEDLYSRVLQKLLHFRIVIRLDLLVRQEVLLHTCMFHELEAVAIECVFIFVSRDIMDNDAQGSMRAHGSVCFSVFILVLDLSSLIYVTNCGRDSPNVERSRWSSIPRILVVVELSRNVVLSRFSLLSKRFDDLVQGISWSVLNCDCSHDGRYMESFLVP